MPAYAAGGEKGSPLESMKIQKSRVQGNWQVRCEIDHPAEAEVAEASKLLEQACRSAAARFSAKDHSQSGGLYRQEVGAPKPNKDRSKLSIEILLRQQ
jgi:hypothetical protein